MDNRDLIKQYVDTGVQIPEYQFNQLSGSDKKTYLRKRFIAQNNEVNLQGYELNSMDIEQQKAFIEKHNLNAILFTKVSDEIKDFYLDRTIEKGYIINPDLYWYFNNKSKLKYLKALAIKDFNWQWFLDELSPEELEYYNKIKNEQ
jgi:hypothetical protein